MNNKTQQIFQWQQQGFIDKKDIDKALNVTQAVPNGQQWYDFIVRSLLYLSVLSLACGVIFFFAYNWGYLSTFNKFAMLQSAMLISLVIYTQTRQYNYVNKAALLLMIMLIGTLFALFGQTYQTGKDPWQLFAMWALCSTPLAYQSRSSFIWLMWLGLVNLAMVLYVNVNLGIFGLIFDHENYLFLFAGVNTFTLILFEKLHQLSLLPNRIPAQGTSAIIMITSTIMASYAVLGKYDNDLYFTTYVIWMIAVYFFYRIKTLDLFILSTAVISVICITVTLFIRLADYIYNEVILLLASVVIIFLSTKGVKWLIKLSHENNERAEKS